MKVVEYWHGTIKNYRYNEDVSGTILVLVSFKFFIVINIYKSQVTQRIELCSPATAPEKSLMSIHNLLLVDVVGPPSAEVCRRVENFPQVDDVRFINPWEA